MEQVKVGQVWVDNDKRHTTRHLRVEGVYEHKAKCWSYYSNELAGRFVWIRLDRFRPNATGYRLVSEA